MLTHWSTILLCLGFALAQLSPPVPSPEQREQECAAHIAKALPITPGARLPERFEGETCESTWFFPTYLYTYLTKPSTRPRLRHRLHYHPHDALHIPRRMHLTTELRHADRRGAAGVRRDRQVLHRPRVREIVPRRAVQVHRHAGDAGGHEFRTGPVQESVLLLREARDGQGVSDVL
jgi:hypothetical protein